MGYLFYFYWSNTCLDFISIFLVGPSPVLPVKFHGVQYKELIVSSEPLFIEFRNIHWGEIRTFPLCCKKTHDIVSFVIQLHLLTVLFYIKPYSLSAILRTSHWSSVSLYKHILKVTLKAWDIPSFPHPSFSDLIHLLWVRKKSISKVLESSL